MKKAMSVLAGVSMITLLLSVGAAWAGATVTVTREESKPDPVEVKTGEEVYFVNASGGTAHVSFEGNETVQFYVGRADSRVKFEKPGTYRYFVHVSGVKGHAHTGHVVVK